MSKPKPSPRHVNPLEHLLPSYKGKKWKAERSCDGPECVEKFIPSREWQVYCSAACRQAAFQQAKAKKEEQQARALKAAIADYEAEIAKLRKQLENNRT